MEHEDISDAEHKMAPGTFEDARRQDALFLFAMVELDFDEFMVFEGLIEGSEEGVGDAGLADFEDGFEVLSLGLETAEFWS
jgi:hypothetical protein